MAATDLSAGITVGGEYDSNALGVSRDQVRVQEANGAISGQDDFAKRYTANLAASTGINTPLTIKLKSQYTRVDYTDINSLDHSEYNLGASLDWKPSRVFDTSLTASQVRAPIDLNDVGGTRSVQQTTQQADATLRVRPTPNWQLSAIPGWYSYKLPQADGSELELRETSGTAQIDYLGVGRLVPGVYVKESRGKYYDVLNATRYTQQTAGVSLNYKVTDFSTFNLLAGYVRRNTHLVVPSNDPVALSFEGSRSGFTGNLSYQRQLTVKTSVNVSAFRAFQQYDVGVNTTIGTGFSVGATWKATAKFSTTLDGGLVWLTIDNPQVAQTAAERKDLQRRLSLSGKYLATHRLSLRAYAERDLNNSTLRTGVYNQTIAGLELTATFD